MSFDMPNLRKLEQGIPIAIPTDSEGLIGRECPKEDCEGYFKVKLGTGFIGKDLPCHCPYCGHTDSPSHFWTKEQIEYARSIAVNKVTDALERDLKTLEFETKPKGPLGIGMSLKYHKGAPVPIRYYREKALETKVICDACTLEYAVYGVFAFCPDCGKHNSIQILKKNVDLARRQLTLSNQQQDAEMKRYLVEDALENCVSAFDGFARESCRVRATKSTNPSRATAVSFQNIDKVSGNLKDLFGFDLRELVQPDDWNQIVVGFQKRHLVAHRSGVVDELYISATGEDRQLIGRKISISEDEVERLTHLIVNLGEKLLAQLPSP
jgi:hypothetical protein